MLIILIIFSLLLFAATVCGVSKMGEKEGICKYGYMEDEEQ